MSVKRKVIVPCGSSATAPRVSHRDAFVPRPSRPGAASDVDAALALYERKGNLVMAERARRLATPVAG